MNSKKSGKSSPVPQQQQGELIIGMHGLLSFDLLNVAKTKLVFIQAR